MNKKSLVRIIAILVIAGFIIGAFIFFRTWYMPHRNVKNEKGIQVTAQAIMDAYSADEKKANTVYLDKAIEVNGEVSDLAKNEAGKTVISLKTNDPMGGVRCTMKEDVGNIKKGDNVTVKGICSGYLMDVTLIECYLDR
jgi:hypothetical protein